VCRLATADRTVRQIEPVAWRALGSPDTVATTRTGGDAKCVDLVGVVVVEQQVPEELVESG
jgi:hypothetical protein